MITFFAADLFSPLTIAVTSRPLLTASFVISCPAFPFAQITAIFVIKFLLKNDLLGLFFGRFKRLISFLDSMITQLLTLVKYALLGN